ncbi:MAG: DUF885 domain-containing protein [Acidobacteriota bacterium]
MRFSSSIAAICVLCTVMTAASFTACSRENAANETPSGDSSRSSTDEQEARIDRFFAEVYERRVAQSPIEQSRLGRKTNRLGEWDDFSDDFYFEQIEQTKADLERLRSEFDVTALGEQARLSYELFEIDAERRIRNAEFRRHFYVVDQFNEQLSGLITVLQNNHDIDSVQDAEDYISRIAGLEVVLEEFVSQLRDREEFGVVAPAFSFPAVLADARSISSGSPIDDSAGENTIYVDFRNKLADLDLDTEDRNDLLDRATAALQGPFASGFASLIGEIERMQDLYDDENGVWALPKGEAFYDNRVRYHTTLDISAREVHAIGLAEVARIQDEMRAIQKEVGFEGDLQDFFDFVRRDPNNYYEDSDAGREQFLDDARRQVADIYAVVGDYFNQLPRAAMEVRRVEPWRENSTSIAFYSRPSEDGSRPGIYYANLADMHSVQRYVFVAITYHESVPGHHFQIALAQEIEGIPDFRRDANYGAFTEGWALYAEQLAREMGFYEDPYENFGRLQNELWRAVRLVLDTGIHSLRWTRQDAIDYFRANTPLSEGDIVTEVERFFVNPGQGLSYKMGMIEILALRQQAREALGDRFDIRQFHDVVIGSGPMPLPMLERRVEHYIAATLDTDANQEDLSDPTVGA